MFPYGIGLEKIFQKKRIRIPAFIVNEILVKADKEDVSPWIAIELSDKIIPDIRTTVERNMLVVK